MDKNYVRKALNIEPKIGGSYLFEEERLFRPNWLRGVYIEKSRLWYSVNGWTKIEYFIEGKWEKFFEGNIETKEEFDTLIKIVGFKDR